jgi:adenine-specific DNA-methyltransferase
LRFGPVACERTPLRFRRTARHSAEIRYRIAADRHVAQSQPVPVLAADLQEYSVALAAAVICRNRALNATRIWEEWFSSADKFVAKVAEPPAITWKSASEVTVARMWSEAQADLPITAAYGGHYFSPFQTIWLDALRFNLLRQKESRQLALASLIQAASHCAASPGHTAQPFQPTKTAKRFLFESWSRSIVDQTRRNLLSLASLAAREKGAAVRADANILAEQMTEDDLVFLDPPYSGVHYSRFYHVLESVASGSPGIVSGIGRYPPSISRPRSRYSVQTEAAAALDQLLGSLGQNGAKVILTFPDHECSNGLSGEQVQIIASRYFKIRRKVISSRFSSLGGTSDGRANQAGRNARLNAQELILLLRPL